MEQYLFISLVLNFFIISTYCCVMSGRGECFMSGLSFGGRMILPENVAELVTGTASPWIRKRVFIFQEPRSLRKGKRVRSMLGHSGFGRIWRSDSDSCHISTADNNYCPTTESKSTPCLDKSVPCGMDLGAPNALVISLNAPSSGITVTLPIRPDFTVGNVSITGYKVEYRKLDSIKWSSLEYTDTQPKQLLGVLDEGYTYELRTSLKYGDSYGTPEAFQLFTMPCGDIVVNLELSSLSKRRGMACVIADWTHRDLTVPCGVINKMISVQQLDLDYCRPVEENSTNEILSDESHYRLRKIRPNSEYNVSLTVITRTSNFTVWKTIRTVKTAPTGSPEPQIKRGRRARRLTIRWEQLLCGQRNGNVTSYDIKFKRGDGTAVVYSIKHKMATFNRFHVGETFEVKLRAVSPKGAGPYSENYVGTY